MESEFKNGSRARRVVAVAMSVLGLGCGEATQAVAPPEAEQLGSQEQRLEHVVVPVSISTEAVLGQGRNSITHEFRGMCVSAPTVNIPTQEATVRFDSSFSRDETSEMLGFSVEAKAKFAKWGASARAKFSRSLESKTYSMTQVYGADYRLETRKLDESQLNWLVSPTASDWLTRCGDEFVMQKQVGGQLFLLYRIDFDSVETKSEFQAAVGANWGAGDVNAEVQKKAQQFRGRASVHVEAFQSGGDVTQLGNIFSGIGGTVEPGRAAVDCNIDNLTACGEFMRLGLAYATAQTPDAFQPNLRANPADRTYLLKDWGVLGVPMPPRIVTTQIQYARRHLEELFDLQLEIQDRIQTLRRSQFPLRTEVQALMQQYDSESQYNISLILAASQKCYDLLTDMNNAAQVAACVDGAQESNMPGFKALDVRRLDLRLPYTFGGMYQVDDSQTPVTIKLPFGGSFTIQPANVANPATGGLSCPAGFSPYRYGRILTPGTGRGGNQYLCMGTTTDTSLTWHFAGSYQKDTDGNYVVGNPYYPITLTFPKTTIYLAGCPSSTALKMGSAQVPTTDGSTIAVEKFMCSTMTWTTGSMKFAGMYQIDPCGSDSVPNPFTGNMGCPAGYIAMRFGQVITPTSRCTATQYLCKSQY
ncbi:hypothetical protein NR798_00920 [Archangium gephyra]|uniref:hypothetical protein n=1 Tax=Archangium gephyra TaxID=48 RepID=UPI0035D4254E